MTGWGQLLDTLRQTHWSGWLTLVVGVVGGLVLGRAVGAILRMIGARFERRGWEGRKIVFCAAAGPAALAIFTLGLAIGLAPVAMGPWLSDFSRRVVTLLYILAGAWFLYNLVDLADFTLRRFTARREKSYLDQQIGPIVRKTLRTFLVVIFILFTAQNVLGANIGAWLAGFGIAGLAVSLAAQDSLRNLFGSLMIFLDRPFAVGETIQFDRWEGVVEDIGFRSTRLRAQDGFVVTIPNSRLADNPIVNLDRRLHIRRLFNLVLSRDNPPEKIEQALEVIRDVLHDDDIASNFALTTHPPRIAFDEYAPGGHPNVRISYWYAGGDQWAYMEHAQRVNLRILRGLADAGIKMA
jgi:MscS family membrane protein